MCGMMDSVSEPSPLRIGDAERDDAAELLREHLSAGRLRLDEFDERLGQALAARTQPELDALFTDLPGRRPGRSSAPAIPTLDPIGAATEKVPSPTGEQPAPAQERPWWTSFWIFPAAIALAAVTSGRMGPLVALAAVWVFWLGPTIAAGTQSRQLPDQQRRELD